MTSPTNKKEQNLQTSAAVEPASTAVVTFTAEGTSFLEGLAALDGTQIVRISAPNVDRPVSPGSQGLAAAVADGFTLPKTAQLTLVLQNIAPDARVLGVRLALIDLDQPPIPFGAMGNLAGQNVASGVAAAQVMPAQAPSAYRTAADRPEYPASAQVPAPVRAAAPTMADIARAQNPGMPLNADGSVDTSQLPDDTVLQPTSSDGRFQQYAPVIRYPGDRRPPPAKTAAIGGPSVRVVGPGSFVGNGIPGAAPGQPGPGVTRTGAVVTNAQNPAVVGHAPVAAGGLRNPVDVRGPIAQVTPDPRPTVVVTNAQGQMVAGVPQFIPSGEPGSSEPHLGQETTGKFPVVLRHPVAKSVWRMLTEKLPITKMHRDATNGALAHAQSIPREPYYGEGNRQRLWNNGSVVAWLAPKNLGALHRLMAMGQGTGTGPVDHDALPDLVEAFQNALANPFNTGVSLLYPTPTTNLVPSPSEPGSLADSIRSQGPAQVSVPGNTPAQQQFSPEAIPPPA